MGCRPPIVLALALLLVPATARALTVTATADGHDAAPGDGACDTGGGDCTLRAAVEEVAAMPAGPGAVQIDVPAGSYAVSLGDLVPSCPGCTLTIQGAGPGLTEIDAGMAGATIQTSTPIVLDGLGLRHVAVSGTGWQIAHCEISDVAGVAVRSPQFDVAIADSVITRADRALDVDSGTIAIDRVQIRALTSNPAIFLEHAHADLRDSEITDNPEAYAVDGIGHTVRVERSLLARNTGGVSVCTLFGRAEVVDSTIADNRREGVVGTSVLVAGSTVARNGLWGVLASGFCTATTEAADASVQTSIVESNFLGIAGLGRVTAIDVRDTIVRGNVGYGIAASGSPVGGALHVTRTWVTRNFSNGLLLSGSPGQVLVATIDASTISDNRAHDGAGVRAQGALTSASGAFLVLDMANTTVSQNHGKGSGAGIDVQETGVVVRLNGCTITGNVIAQPGFGVSGGGVRIHSTSTLVARNTIIAGNLDQAGGGAPDCAGEIVSEGHDLIGDTSGCTVSGDPTGNLLGVDPLLAPLADYGGPTPTHALSAGSPAIDAGDPAAPGSGGTSCPAEDQRGIVRPEGARCDIGALEHTCADGTSDPGEPCACPPQAPGVCVTTTTSTTTTTAASTTTPPTTGFTTRSTTTTSTTTTTTTTAPPAGCPAAPAAGCTDPPSAPRGTLETRNRTPDTRDRLRWRWPAGSAGLDSPLLGDPLAATDYAFCVYAGGTLRTSALVPAGATCGADPCWQRSGDVLRYTDRAATRGGIRRMVLRPGRRRGRLIVSAEGGALGLGPATPLPLPVDVQLRAGTGACFGTRFSLPQRNDGAVFRARSD